MFQISVLTKVTLNLHPILMKLFVKATSGDCLLYGDI